MSENCKHKFVSMGVNERTQFTILGKQTQSVPVIVCEKCGEALNWVKV